ncbi:C40 family peptidase [Paenibacillus silviterrae]|uniref:C40 family peptidase n=1 Tax=Paenibacillus silviterrae TaxID=3242194 RepID=UPI002543E6B2|nr:SH3 domain-containing C40 family peptidase [Paenibacillus chinjuensis]
MKKMWIAGLAMLMMCMLLVPMQAAKAAETVTKLKATKSVSFRDKPSTSSNVMRYLKAGEVVTALQMVNPNWYQIQDAQGLTGYVSSSGTYIDVLSNAEVIAKVNFRTQPSTSSSIIRSLPVGEGLYVIEKVNASWYRAEDASGVSGYVSTGSQYLATDFSVTGVILPMAERVDSIINSGTAYLGTPYEFGSTRWEDSTFDCSDFMQTIFWLGARTVLPSDSQAQADYVRGKGNQVNDWSQLKRGDLMFFMSYKGSSASDYQGINKSTEPVTHVGIYLGDGQMLHTYSVASGGVRIDSISGTQWNNRFLYGGSAY